MRKLKMLIFPVLLLLVLGSIGMTLAYKKYLSNEYIPSNKIFENGIRYAYSMNCMPPSYINNYHQSQGKFWKAQCTAYSGYITAFGSKA